MLDSVFLDLLYRSLNNAYTIEELTKVLRGTETYGVKWHSLLLFDSRENRGRK